MIGAGSVIFSKNLTGDILGFPEFRNATLTYMDIDQERLAYFAAGGHPDRGRSARRGQPGLHA